MLYEYMKYNVKIKHDKIEEVFYGLENKWYWNDFSENIILCVIQITFIITSIHISINVIDK